MNSIETTGLRRRFGKEEAVHGLTRADGSAILGRSSTVLSDVVSGAGEPAARVIRAA